MRGREIEQESEECVEYKHGFLRVDFAVLFLAHVNAHDGGEAKCTDRTLSAVPMTGTVFQPQSVMRGMVRAVNAREGTGTDSASARKRHHLLGQLPMWKRMSTHREGPPTSTTLPRASYKKRPLSMPWLHSTTGTQKMEHIANDHGNALMHRSGKSSPSGAMSVMMKILIGWSQATSVIRESRQIYPTTKQITSGVLTRPIGSHLRMTPEMAT